MNKLERHNQFIDNLIEITNENINVNNFNSDENLIDYLLDQCYLDIENLEYKKVKCQICNLHILNYACLIKSNKTNKSISVGSECLSKYNIKVKTKCFTLKQNTEYISYINMSSGKLAFTQIPIYYIEYYKSMFDKLIETHSIKDIEYEWVDYAYISDNQINTYIKYNKNYLIKNNTEIDDFYKICELSDINPELYNFNLNTIENINSLKNQFYNQIIPEKYTELKTLLVLERNEDKQYLKLIDLNTKYSCFTFLNKIDYKYRNLKKYDIIDISGYVIGNNIYNNFLTVYFTLIHPEIHIKYKSPQTIINITKDIRYINYEFEDGDNKRIGYIFTIDDVEYKLPISPKRLKNPIGHRFIVKYDNILGITK